MESKLAKLKTDFNNIINIRTTVKNIFDILQIRIDKLKLLYAEFIKTSKTQMFIFGLDSFHFQSKLIDIEYDDMKRLFLAINNRMYCEYFKLYKIIIDYIMVNISDRKITEIVKVNSYPVYKDLEPFKEYKFEIILDMHENILNLLGILISTLNNKENELLLHKNKQNIGLNIDNFITTFNYSIIVMREKMCKEEFDRLMETSPNIPEKIIKEFKRNFINHDGFDEIVKPEICDTLIPTSNYRNPWFNDENREKSLNENIKIQLVKQNKLRKITIQNNKIIKEFINSFNSLNNREPMESEIIDNLKDKMDISVIKKILEETKSMAFKVNNDSDPSTMV